MRLTSLASGSEATPTRQQILRLLWREPGLSTRGVARGVDLDESSAAYHLHRLERAGAVVCERIGRIVAHYPNGWGNATARKYAVLSPEARVVLDVLREEAIALRAVDVSRRSGLRVGAVRHALSLATRLGLARRARRGRYEVVVHG